MLEPGLGEQVRDSRALLVVPAAPPDHLVGALQRIDVYVDVLLGRDHGVRERQRLRVEVDLVPPGQRAAPVEDDGLDLHGATVVGRSGTEPAGHGVRDPSWLSCRPAQRSAGSCPADRPAPTAQRSTWRSGWASRTAAGARAVVARKTSPTLRDCCAPIPSWSRHPRPTRPCAPSGTCATATPPCCSPTGRTRCPAERRSPATWRRGSGAPCSSRPPARWRPYGRGFTSCASSRLSPSCSTWPVRARARNQGCTPLPAACWSRSWRHPLTTGSD